MTSSKSSVLLLDDDNQDPQSELQFQDFTLGRDPADVATLSPSGSFYKDGLDSPGDENADLLGGEQSGSSSFWQFSYYQSFFDVDSDQVVQRIVWSMIPLPGRATYLDRQIRPKPDMYGPFWIATTLVFSTAICANIANYLTHQGRDSRAWTYDFHKVSLAATAIYSYTLLLPILLWGLMWYRQSSNRYSLLEILSVYGYSLAIYVPVSVLWVIQVSWLQWILVIVGAVLSGTVLIQTFWPIFKEDNKKIAAVVLCLILVFHTLLAVGFVVYFFRPSHDVHHAKVSSATTSMLSSMKTHSVIEENNLNPTVKSMSLIKENKTEQQTKEINHKILNKIVTTKVDEKNSTFPFNNTGHIVANVVVTS